MKRANWFFLMLATAALAHGQRALVLQTDFGLKDGAVAAMRGVAFGVSPRLAIFDLSHENTPFDIWEAAYRLKQTVPFWPAGTVKIPVSGRFIRFVVLINPGADATAQGLGILEAILPPPFTPAHAGATGQGLIFIKERGAAGLLSGDTAQAH